MLIFLIIVIGLIAIDQIIKYVCATFLLNNVLDLALFKISYFEHSFVIEGISFNWLSILLSVALIVAFVIFFLKRYSKKVRTPMNLVTFSLIIGGGISNLLDRILHGYVIDYISFNHILNGMVFNLADAYIVIGIILLIGMYAIKITDDKVNSMTEGDLDAYKSKTTKQWFKELFKGR